MSLEMSADDTLTATLYPGDPLHYTDFSGEGSCKPCKLIRVNVPRAGMFEVHFILLPQSTDFALSIETNRFSRQVGCCTSDIKGVYTIEAGPVKLYVYTRLGSLVRNQSFELTTALR